MKNAAFTLVMLPPHDAVRRGWAARVAEEPVGVRVLQPETMEQAMRDIAEAEAAFGTIPPELLRAARKLRWLQAPQAAPPAGFYYPELVAHPVVVTNFREIFNDHIGAHIMAFVLAFARDLHTYLPQQMRREYRAKPARHRRCASARGDRADPGRRRHRRRGRAPVQRVRHAGELASMPGAQTNPRAWTSCTAPLSSTRCCRALTSSS